MHRFTIFSILLIFLVGCAEPKQAEQPKLSAEQKAKVEAFSQQLVASINGSEFSMINNSWNNEAFKARISQRVNKTQQSVLTHIFEKELKMSIKIDNLNIIHRLNSNQGKVSLLRLDHFDHFSELILLMTFDGTYDFFKYRIEYVKNKPALVDFYHFTDNVWYSENVINMLRLNTKYDAFSDERHQAHSAIRTSEQALTYGDTLEALYALYDIPETHQEGNWLSLKKLNLARSLGDTILAEVMVTEHEINKSLYMKYLYNYYFNDTTHLNSTYELLASELGESETLDSLVNSGSLWNMTK